MIFKSSIQTLLSITTIVVTLSVVSFTAIAHDSHVGDIFIDHPVARETPPGSTVSAGYMTITNHGKHDDRLISAYTEHAELTEIHEMSMVGDVMKMGEIEGGILIPAGQFVELMPHGLHVMFMGLKKSLKENETIEVTLTFEKAGSIKTVFLVEKIHSH